MPLGNAADFLGRKPWHVLARYGREFGPLSVIWLDGTPAIVLHDARLIGEVLVERTDDFYKDAPHDALAPVITPQCMFISNGDHWRYMRNGSPYSQPWLSEWLGAQRQLVRDVVRRAVYDWSERPVPDLVEAIRRMAYDVFSCLAWGRTLGGGSYRAFMKLAGEGSPRMQKPPSMAKLPPLSPAYYFSRSQWNQEFREILAVAEVRLEPSKPFDPGYFFAVTHPVGLAAEIEVRNEAESLTLDARFDA